MFIKPGFYRYNLLTVQAVTVADRDESGTTLSFQAHVSLTWSNPPIGIDDDGSEDATEERWEMYLDDYTLRITVYEGHPLYTKLRAWIEANTM